MRLRVLPLADIVAFIVLPGLFVAFTLVQTMRAAGQPTWLHAEDIIVAWALALLWALHAATRLGVRMRMVDLLKFDTRHGLRVGWTRPRYAVAREDVERITQRLLDLLEPSYPGAAKAVEGCYVVFRESTWVQLSSGRFVSGEQDNQVMVVGWDSPLEHSPLGHELAHRVLQVCAGDPPRDEAHAIIHRYDI